MSSNIHPTDSLQCMELRLMQREISKLPNDSENKHIKEVYRNILEEQCNIQKQKEFNQRYYYYPDLNRFGILPNESDKCKLWKTLFSTSDIFSRNYYIRRIMEDC
jgi:hypothetical protein